VLLLGFLTSCASSSLINRFMDPSIPVNEHAVLFVGDGSISQNGYLNGDRLGRTNIIPPGTHLISVRRVESSSSSSGSVTTITTSVSEFVNFHYDFEAGRFYELRQTIQDGYVNFQIVDITDTNNNQVENARRQLNSVNYPTELSFSLTYLPILEEASNAPPSIFEGRWINDNEWILFRGNHYEYHRRGWVSDAPFFQNHYASQASRYIKDISETGTFIIEDNSIIFTPLRYINLGEHNPTDQWRNVTQSVYFHRNFGLPKRFNYSLTQNEVVFTSIQQNIITNYSNAIIWRPTGTFTRQLDQ